MTRPCQLCGVDQDVWGKLHICRPHGEPATSVTKPEGVKRPKRRPTQPRDRQQQRRNKAKRAQARALRASARAQRP